MMWGSFDQYPSRRQLCGAQSVSADDGATVTTTRPHNFRDHISTPFSYYCADQTRCHKADSDTGVNRFRPTPGTQSAAVDGGDSFPGGCRGPVCVEFDAGQVPAGVFGDFDQRGTVADTGIDGLIWCRRQQQCANVLGFFDRQRVVAEL